MRVDRFNSAICHIPFNGVESFFIWNKKKKDTERRRWAFVIWNESVRLTELGKNTVRSKNQNLSFSTKKVDRCDSAGHFGDSHSRHERHKE